MHRSKGHGWIWILVLGLMGVGCGDERSVPLGQGLLEGQGMGKMVSLEPIPALRDSTYRLPTLLGEGKLLIGRTEEMETGVLVRFADLPGGVSVLSADLELYGQDLYGEPSDGLEAPVYEIQSSWEEDELWDGALPTHGGSSIVTVPLDAVAPDTTVIPLPVSMVQTWTDTTAEVENFGLLILPPMEASFLKRFGPLLLKLMYQEGTSDTTTTHFSPSASAFYVRRFTPIRPEDGMVIADGDIYRALAYFPMPDTMHSMATVNSARLEADVRMDTSFASTMWIEVWGRTDGWDGERLQWNVEGLQSLDLTEVEVSTGSVHAVGDTSSTVSLEIRDIVQSWIRDPLSNHGILLRSSREREDVNVLFLHAPRLSILYSEPPEAR